MIPLRLLFPKILPRLISAHMNSFVRPSEVLLAFTSTYLATYREVIR